MVITIITGYIERGRREEEEEGLRRRRSRAGRDAANKPPEPRAVVSDMVVGLREARGRVASARCAHLGRRIDAKL